MKTRLLVSYRFAKPERFRLFLKDQGTKTVVLYLELKILWLNLLTTKPIKSEQHGKAFQ